MRVFLAAATDIGRDRETNEDSFCINPDLMRGRWAGSGSYQKSGDYGAIAVVADGMGGHNAGEVASAIAVDTIKSKFSDCSVIPVLTEPSIKAFLIESIDEANRAILHRVEENPEYLGMGTTIIIVWLIAGVAHIAWCGDCRCYMFRQGTGLKQLTKDHSYVQCLVDSGQLSPEKAFNHPSGHLLTRCLGGIDSYSDADIVSVNVEDGDILLACSDGLCGYCPDRQIEQIVANRTKAIPARVNGLIRAALQRGAGDNITVAALATRPDQGKYGKLLDRIKNCFSGRW